MIKSKAQSGASLVEYALIIALIAIVALVAVRQLGYNTYDTFYSMGRCGFEGKRWSLQTGNCY